LVTDNFITDGTESKIEKPYGIAVNPSNGDIYVTDGKNYVSSGTVHCYNRDGVRQWSMRAGDIPAHMVFLNRDE
jgi:DNA-binding beta-propeller fold protein YncE